MRQPQGLHAATATDRRAHQSERRCRQVLLAASGLRGQAGDWCCQRSRRWLRRAPNARWRRQMSAYRPPPKALALAQGSRHSSSASAASTGTAAGSAACVPALALSTWRAASLARRLARMPCGQLRRRGLLTTLFQTSQDAGREHYIASSGALLCAGWGGRQTRCHMPTRRHMPWCSQCGAMLGLPPAV